MDLKILLLAICNVILVQVLSGEKSRPMIPSIRFFEPDKEPKQPEIGFRNMIKYNAYHKHFHRHSPLHSHIVAAPARSIGAPWPMPKNYIRSNGTEHSFIELNEFYIFVEFHYCDILEFNLRRFWKNTFAGKYNKRYLINKKSELAKLLKQSNHFVRLLNITILKDTSHFPSSSMDESYSLTLDSKHPMRTISLVANEVWGAMRGLETLSQLIMVKGNKFYLENFTIEDSPRFKHRGVMIDTARHFIGKDILIMNLEAMAQNKFNVFHWHLTDDQSFSFDSHSLPNITKYGSYNPETHVYKHSDVREIVEEARLRGIRVIPEFDAPGHSFSWGFGQPGLLSACYDERGNPNRYFGPMNPLREKTYEVLGKIYREILEVFPDNAFHLGGDEVDLECWNNNPEFQQYLRETGFILESVLSNFTSRLQHTVTELFKEREKIRKKVDSNRQQDSPEMIVWQEAFDDKRKMTKDTVIQVWKRGETYISDVVLKGHSVIFSECWYLDATTYGIDWDRFYNCLNQANSHPTDYDGKLIGGEVCLWTEYVNEQTLIAKLWPRASAAAERLWSPVHQNNFEEAAGRLEEHNCRMKRFGIPSGVINGPTFCGENLFRNSKVNVDWPVEEPVTQYVWKFRPRKHKHKGKDSVYIGKLYIGTVVFMAFLLLFMMTRGLIMKHLGSTQKCATLQIIISEIFCIKTFTTNFLTTKRFSCILIIAGMLLLTLNCVYLLSVHGD